MALKEDLDELCASLNRACDIFEEATVYAQHHNNSWIILIRLKEPMTLKLVTPTRSYVKEFCKDKDYDVWSYTTKSPRLMIRFELTPRTPRPYRVPRRSSRRTSANQ